MYLPMLTDEELLRHAEQSLDELSTDLERELVKRFRAAQDASDDYAPLDEVIENHGFDLATLPDILKLLDEHHAGEIDVLREKLERADKFYDIAQDVGDVLDRLTALAKEAA